MPIVTAAGVGLLAVLVRRSSFALAVLSLCLGACQCAEDPRRVGSTARRDAGGAGNGDGGGGSGDVGAGDGAAKDAAPAGDAALPDLGARDALGAQDALQLDAELRDADEPDAESADAVTPDAAPALDAAQPSDAGVPGMGEIWVEIDYSSANGPQSPAWSFSASPGWGPGQWAMAGDSWPEAWDRWNNLAVVNDPIGTVLEIGGGGELQLMIGLEELLGYSGATVHLEGRSRATSSSVQFDVFNPLNGCGGSASMAQDWTLHPVDVDLSGCMVLGGGVQAVRVSPTNGTVALVRMRLTLQGASW